MKIEPRKCDFMGVHHEKYAHFGHILSDFEQIKPQMGLICGIWDQNSWWAHVKKCENYPTNQINLGQLA